MSFDALRSLVRALPEISAWPEMIEIIDSSAHRESVSVWEYPAAACAALGGSRAASLPGEAAIFCSLMSIHLVDDLLDLDPTGIFNRIGAGRAANAALAFQAAAHKLVLQAEVPAVVRVALHGCIAEIFIATAVGQHQDSLEISDEAGYWRVVEAKTPPLFSSALAIGALIAGGSEEVIERLELFGRHLACFIQVSDDLGDALRTPAEADWHKPSGNLALLYASHAGHGDRERFLSLTPRVDDLSLLAEAQSLLLSSGAVSYCVFKMIDFWQAAQATLAELPLTSSAPLHKLLSANLKPLQKLFASLGEELPSGLRAATD